MSVTESGESQTRVSAVQEIKADNHAVSKQIVNSVKDEGIFLGKKIEFWGFVVSLISIGAGVIIYLSHNYAGADEMKAVKADVSGLSKDVSDVKSDVSAIKAQTHEQYVHLEDEAHWHRHQLEEIAKATHAVQVPPPAEISHPSK